MGEFFGVGRGMRRGSDRVEGLVALLLCALGVVAAVVAGGLGVSVQGAVAARAAAEAAERTLVTAEVTQIMGPPSAPETAGAGGRRVRVEWVGAGGEPRGAEVSAGSAARPGTTVRIWLDRAGAVVPAPVSTSAAPLVGWTAGVAAATLAAALLLAAWRLVRSATARHHARAWERGWAEIEPLWSGRTPAG